MLVHDHGKPVLPERVVVLGANGFVGKAATLRLEAEGINVLPLGRNDVDLLARGATEKLLEFLRPSDSLVVVSALAPCKTVTMLSDNIRMIEPVCLALEVQPVSHLVYISSDAVYADSGEPLTEESVVQPDSLHGMMHAARELMLRTSAGEAPYAVLRPSLLYGAADPHGGYGPNLFRRRCQAREDIVLFGEGEERRDHVFIDDVAELILRIIAHKSRGILNAATGEVFSFREIAEMVSAQFVPAARVVGSPRKGAMPHGGYRPFDAAGCRAAFPDFDYTSLSDGLAKTHQEAKG